MNALILGATGMLGSMVLDFLSMKGLEITAPSRKDLDKIKFSDYDYIINCIGITKQKLDNVEEAIRINSLLPYEISRKAPKAKIIQIATDCVFSGKKGRYTEEDEHDALDVYGKTKSLGEVEAKNFYNIRTSIVGPDRNSRASLLEWFLSQKKNAVVNGYTNHQWNGITTLHFAKLCYAIIKKKTSIPNHLHFVPTGIVSKYELLKIFSEKFDRKDIHIKKIKASDEVNRSLRTIHRGTVCDLWKDMGYNSPLSIETMVEELAQYIKDRNFYEL
ncbi:SDR family oxidoreductase [Candidatus Microgenomates bacterium]|nr:SDR family oxidoreductase [Candidatus Microgenomates bacterium]